MKHSNWELKDGEMTIAEEPAILRSSRYVSGTIPQPLILSDGRSAVAAAFPAILGEMGTAGDTT